MITLLGGPCAGSYAVRRAPLFLRAVLNPATNERDVLDQLPDVPASDEQIHVYRLVSEPGRVHLYAGGGKRGQQVNGWYATGSYVHMPEVDGERLRDTHAWRVWTLSQTQDPLTPYPTPAP